MLSLKGKSRTVLLVILLSGLALAGCESVFTPVTPQAQSISTLILALFAVAALVFVVVEGTLLYFVFRFRRARSAHDEMELRNERRIEIAWTAAPAVVLAIVFIISMVILRFLITLPAATSATLPSSSGQTLNIRVVGHQWWWEFDYLDYGIITANEMHAPVGATLLLSVESADVIHSFWSPVFGGKVDAIPGQTNRIIYTPTKVGEYGGQCSEFCGVDHAFMLFRLIVEPQGEFERWVKQQQSPAATMTGNAARGEQIFMSGSCIGCHTVNGTIARGTLGPNLTHFASRGTFAGATHPNTRNDLMKWLQDPQALKPGNYMPNLHLTPSQIEALADYLENLR